MRKSFVGIKMSMSPADDWPSAHACDLNSGQDSHVKSCGTVKYRLYFYLVELINASNNYIIVMLYDSLLLNYRIGYGQPQYVRSGMGAYAGAARRRVHLATVLTFVLRLAIAQADAEPATPLFLRGST